MTGSTLRRTHTIFMRALELDGGQRETYLTTACGGDAALESGVRRLLAAVPRSSSFLETPVAAAPIRTAPPPLDPAAIIVPGYRIVRLLGVGGMASVFEAEQAEPRRPVALKVMSRGLAGTSALRRFQFETEVLARLQHPGIAQIYEAGTCDDGAGRPLPFFAMEHVREAVHIVEYVRANRISLRARLDLLAQVCDAVQHGHQHGVIHRDLKPGNILVGCDGRPKVIDFGVARPADPDQAGLTLHAERAQLVGTLNAMSPEQCAGAAVDIRTDVYSLGVVGYQLVSGRLPHDMSGVSIPEAIRMIQNDAPPRLGTLVPAARGEVEAIIAKAMEKEPKQRYADAASLAADIRRFLRNEPIEARPATAIYHLRKFARRNPALAASIAAVFVTLAGGVGATTRMTFVATAARQAAEQREHDLEQVTTFQQAQLGSIDPYEMGKQIRARLLEAADGKSAGGSAAAEPAAIEDADSDLERLIANVNFTTVAMRTLDDSVLQPARVAIDRQFAGQPLLRARLLQSLAGTMFSLGLPARAEPVLEEALGVRRDLLGDRHPDTLQSLHAKGSVLSALGRHDEAIACLREAHSVRAKVLGPEHSETLRTGTSLGGALRRAGRVEEAEEVWSRTLAAQKRALGESHPETLKSLSNMGVILAVQGRLGEAERAWREVLERRDRLPEDEQKLVTAPLANLGAVLHDQGRLDEARPLLERDLAECRARLGDDHPSTLISMADLAGLLAELHEFDAAEQLGRERVERSRRAHGREHAQTLRAQVELASILHAAGRTGEAEPLLRQTVAAQIRTLGQAHSDVAAATALLAKMRETVPPDGEGGPR